MLRKFSFLIVANLSYVALAMDLQDAQMLAQGHSQDSYVNLERVGQIAHALTIIRQAHPALQNIHPGGNLAVSIELPYPSSTAQQDLNDIIEITEQFNGKARINNFAGIHRTIVDINFSGNVELATVVMRYRQALGHAQVSGSIGHAFSCGSGDPDVSLKDVASNWVFTFHDPNRSENFRKKYTIAYNPASSAIVNYEVQESVRSE